MGIKKLAFFINLFFVFSVYSQECGTVLPPNYTATRQHYNQLRSAGALLPHDTCLKKELSIVFYIFLDSLGTNNVPAANITTCLNNLNKYFKPICIKFLNCSTRTVPEYEYNEWDRPNHQYKIVGNFNWHTDKTINIYLVDNIVVPGGANGYADAGDNLIVMKKSALTGLTPVHEMGHFFGLPHTFEPTVPTELVRRTNCYTTGDMFCDTDADPYPITGPPPLGPCGFTYGPTDPAGDYYVPPVDNIMSYWGCRCRFTQEQYNYMAWTYITSLSYLH
jgi:hypothetical protein